MFNLTITKLYSLSLLVNLNARDTWLHDGSTSASRSHGTSDRARTSRSRGGRRGGTSASTSMGMGMGIMHDDARRVSAKLDSRQRGTLTCSFDGCARAGDA